jgi:hypothetical protein
MADPTKTADGLDAILARAEQSVLVGEAGRSRVSAVCEHDFSDPNQWRELPAPRHGGERVCAKCGMGATSVSSAKSVKPSICDCELSHNGLGMVGRECDCPAGIGGYE